MLETLEVPESPGGLALPISDGSGAAPSTAANATIIATVATITMAGRTRSRGPVFRKLRLLFRPPRERWRIDFATRP